MLDDDSSATQQNKLPELPAVRDGPFLNTTQ
jgi:hypothetical protein